MKKTFLALLPGATLLAFLSVSLTAHGVSPGTLTGNTPAEFDVTYGGAASYKVPLNIPTGAAGLQPSISLNYNSQFGNGVMGLGWQLAAGVARIEECYKRGTGTRINCLNGEELVSIGGGYYRTEIDSGVLVQAVNSTTFKLQFENGDTKTLTRRLTSPNVFLEASHVQRGGASYAVNWSVNTTNREPLVTSITYQGNEIQFIYQTRTDIRKGYWLGAVRNSTQRLQSVIAKADGQVYRKYDVFYAQDDVSGLSKVTDIQECASSGGCLKPLSFGWTDSGESGYSAPSVYPSKSATRGLANLNNDGKQDTVGGSVSSQYKYYYGDLNGDGKDETVTAEHSSEGIQLIIDGSRFTANNVGARLGKLLISPPYEEVLSLVDVNGDGKVEVVVSQLAGKKVAFINPYNQSGGAIIDVPYGDLSNCEYTRNFADINGDNLPDLIVTVIGHTAQGNCVPALTSYVYLNRGNFQFSQTAIRSTPTDMKTGSIYFRSFNDINGDGNSDLIYTRNPSDDTNMPEFYVPSLGDGRFGAPMPLPGYDEVGGESFHFIDVNADGLDDWMKCTKSKCGVALNKGNGTFMSFEWLIAAAQAAMYIGDFDGDASNDILFYNALYSSITHGVSHHPYINTFTDSNGNQHQVEYAKLTDPEVYTRDAYNAGLSFAKSRPYQQPLTVVKSLTTPNHQVYYKYAGARMDNGKYGYLGFKSITSVLAKEDEAGAPQSLVTVSYLNQDYPLVGKLQTVKKKVYPGTADKLVGDISYAYDGEHDYLVAMLDGSPVGAATTSALADNIQARGDVATGTDFSGQMNSYFDWQYLSLTGGVYKTFLAEKVVDHLQLSNDALIKTERTEAVWTKATSNYARLLETTSGVYDAAGKLVQEQQTAITYEYTDSYGLPSSFLVDDSTVTTTLYSNGNPIGNHSVAMEYDYFGNGLVQYQWLNRNDAKGTRSSYQYDGYGNVTDMTVEAVNAAASRSESERSTTKTYTNQGKYLYSEANSLGHTTTYESYTVHGLPQRTTDPKGLVTTFTYDGLGRLATTTDYLNNTHRTLRGFCSVTNTGCTNGAYVWEKQEPAGSAQSYTWWDKKGQVVKTATQSLQSSAWVVQAWVYDPYGREAKASVPKLLSLSSSVSFSASSDRAYTEQTYDELNRVVRKQLPGVNRVVTKDYRDQLDVVTIDPAGRRTATITNALGQTTRKEQPDNTAILFTYNAQGLVTKQQYPKLSTSGSILSGQYNQIVNGYDNYGNQISLSDPNQGTWTYQYNAFGELIQQTDARGKSTLFSYDELGRMVSQRDDETYSVWTYDTEELGLLDVVSQYRISSLSASAKAALTPANVAATSGVTLAWQQATDYDDSSMLPTWQQTKQRNRSGQVLTSIATTDYDGYGRVQYSQLPSLYQNKGSLSAPRLAYSYSSSGYLSQIKDRDSSTVYQKVDSIDAFDNITAQTLSGGVELYRSYNANTGWANDLQAVNSSGLIIDQSYGSYNKLGHIGSRDDATYYSNGSYQTWSDSFSYADRLKQQLTGVTTQYSQNINGISLNQNWSHSYSYDALGNIRTKATTAMEGGSAGNAGSSYQYQYNNTARPHQLSATTGSVSHSYSYDANGNTTNDGSKTFTYNAWNKVNTITKGSNNTRFEYGPDRTRYLRVDVEGGTTTETLYVGDGYERVTTGSTVQHKYTLHGIALVIQTEGANTEATQGMISDYQDSLLAITDHNGNLQQRFRYTPFGEQVEVSAGVTGAKSFTTHGYTSHEHIEGMDVIHMGGRIYDPVIGRMLQSDPIVQAPQNILSYNRYSYVWNNPMNRVDPTGYTSNSSSGPGGENTEDQAQGNATSSAEDANTNGKDPFAGLSDAELEALIAKSCTCVSFDERGIQTITIYGNWSDLPALEDGDTDDSGSGQPGFGDDEAGGLGGGAGRGNGGPGQMGHGSKGEMTSAEWWAIAEVVSEIGSYAIMFIPFRVNIPRAPAPRVGVPIKTDTLRPGPFAKESVPGHRGRPTADEQRKVNELMEKYGCHTCGTKDPGTKSKNAVVDHQPPQALDETIDFFPHCINCARRQGGQVRQEQIRRR